MYKLTRLILLLCIIHVELTSLFSQENIPHLQKDSNKYALIVGGKPFIILGAQLWNSSAWPYLTDQFWNQAKELGCNTIEAPVYWQNIEPEPGTYQFSELENLILEARRHDLKLVLLWFGSYKNGRSQYAPPWILENTVKYPRMKNRAGQEIYVLSAVSRNNLNADKKAFTEVMKFIRKIDSDDHTVIMMQVENEPGSMWTDRDYSPEAETIYSAMVPEELVHKLKMGEGTWEDVFKKDAPESFNAYCIASYINEIARAGKEIYPLPMYANVWIRENAFQRPGEYPSGGPTSNMLDIWKATAPHLDLLALDIYKGNPVVFDQLCTAYHRPDNPLFIPEMGNGTSFARFQFYAIGNHDAIGVAPYGIDPFHVDPHDQREKDHLDQRFDDIARNFHLLKKAIYPIHELQGSDKLFAVGEEEGLNEQLVQFEQYDVLFSFGFPTYKDRARRTGRVLIGQLDQDEFLLIGFDTKFTFRPSYRSGYDSAEFILVEQGHYEDDRWVRERIWNGDALYHSTLPTQGAILKIKLRRVSATTDFKEKANFDKN